MLESTFAEDIPDLKAEPTEIVKVDNMKPDDTMIRTFELQNNGTHDMLRVIWMLNIPWMRRKGILRKTSVSHPV